MSFQILLFIVSNYNIMMDMSQIQVTLAKFMKLS